MPWCFLVLQRPRSTTLSHGTLLESPEETRHLSTSFGLPFTTTPLLAVAWQVCSLAGWPVRRALGRENVAFRKGKSHRSP